MHLKACHTADLYVVTHGQDIRLYLAIPGPARPCASLTFFIKELKLW
jgi:hypothetical protein